MNSRYYPALAGAIFFVLAIAGTLSYPAAPDFLADAGEIVAFDEEHGADLLPTYGLYALAAAALIWFVGLLADRLRTPGHDGGDGSRASAYVALAAGGATAACMTAAASTGAVTALRVDEQDAIDPGVATTLFDLGNILYGMAAPAAAGVMVLAVAVASFRAGFVPRWLGGLSAAFGIALLIPQISFLAINGLGIWALASGVALALDARSDRGLEAASSRAASLA